MDLNPLQCVSSKSLCQNKPGKKVLQKLNRDHVTKVALKNQGKLKKLKKTKREFDFVVPTMERLCEAKLIHHEGKAL